MQTTRRIIGSAAVAGLLLAGAACGDGGKNANRVASLSGATATTRPSGSSKDSKKNFQDALLEYSKCMRAHGVDMPDPTFTDTGTGGQGFIAKADGPGKGGMSPDSSTFKAAETACKPIMDKAEQDMPRPSPEEEAKMRDQALKFAKCMRDHGVDMPDPTFDANGGTKIEIHRSDASGGDTASNGASTNGAPPKMDAKFEAAMKACEKDSPIKTAGAAKT